MPPENVLAFEDTSNEDTIRSARRLLDDAVAGQLRGFSYATSYKNGDCNVNAAGSHAENPIFAIGASMMLVYHLLKKACG